MLTKERGSLSLSKRPAVTDSGAFDWFDKLTNRRLVSLPNCGHRANASAYFVDHFLFESVPKSGAGFFCGAFDSGGSGV
jgi:hypothetical protein